MAVPTNQQGGDFVGRMRLAQEGEIYGIVLGNMGSSRLLIECQDGKERLCRIPGKIRRHIWVREGDIVLIKPWKIEKDSKGDLIWRYNRLQADYLRKKRIV